MTVWTVINIIISRVCFSLYSIQGTLSSILTKAYSIFIAMSFFWWIGCWWWVMSSSILVNKSMSCSNLHVSCNDYPDSKVHGANMGPIWGRQDPGGPHVGPMNFAIWVTICKTAMYLENNTSNINICRNYKNCSIHLKHLKLDKLERPFWEYPPQ